MITTAIGTQDTRIEYRPTVDLIDQEVVGVSMSMVPVLPYRSGETLSDESLVELAEAIPNRLSRLLDEGLSTLSGWLDRDLRIEIAFPLSSRDLAGPGLADLIDGALAAYHIDPALLTFEIGQASVLADPAIVGSVVSALHDRRVRVSIDRFSHGIPAAELAELRIDEIKISPSPVRGLLDDPSDMALVQNILALSRSMGWCSVATGVEAEAVRDALRGLRSDRMQGNLLSRPLPIEKLEAWFRSRDTRRHFHW
jgi:EAL domain-containing protein (putative c-di-GMP-specific phosphodiesterase class I)